MTTSRFSGISGPPFPPINSNQSSTDHWTVYMHIITQILFFLPIFLGEKLDNNHTVPKKENTMVILIVPYHKSFGGALMARERVPLSSPQKW